MYRQILYKAIIASSLPMATTALEANLSVVSLLVNLRKIMPGKMTHMDEPMVLPTKPRTSSMSGMRIPTMRQTTIRQPVIMLNLVHKPC